MAYTVTFSEPVTGVAAADFKLALGGTVAATVTQVTPVSSAVYTVTIGGVTGNGTLGLNLLDNGSIRDLAGNPLTQQNAKAAFQAAQTFAQGGDSATDGVRALALGDFTANGNADLAVVNEVNLTVLLGNGNGTFGVPQTYTTGIDPISVAVSDLTGDGKSDIVVANAYSNTVSVLLGNGNGTFQNQQTFATGNEPNSVVVGDVNGDGNGDLIVANSYSNTVSVLLGNGNGTFQTQQTFATGSFPDSVALADLAGDGKPDVVVSNINDDSVSVLLGNGDGTFQAQQTFNAGSRPFSLAISDLTGDGKDDIVAGDAGNYSVSVLLGNGNGTFQTPKSFTSGSGRFSNAIGDLTGDGIPDLVTANSQGNNVSIFLGNGNGTFQLQQTLAAVHEPYAIATADLTGDGRPDIIVTCLNSTTGSVFLNAVNGSFTGQVYTISAPVSPRFTVTAPIQTTTGNGFVFTVTALTTTGNLNPAYTGTVHFSSTDPLAGLPANAALFNGTGVFAAVLNTLGTQTITVNDTSSTGNTGTSAPITVVPPATASFSIAANPRTIPAGSAIVLEVAALDAKSNVIPSFSGTVHFSSSDAQAGLPADATFTNGIGYFSAILKTAGRQTLYVSDKANGGATGTSAPITVTPLAASHFRVSAPAAAVTGNAFAFTVTALDQFGNIAHQLCRHRPLHQQRQCRHIAAGRHPIGRHRHFDRHAEHGRQLHAVGLGRRRHHGHQQRHCRAVWRSAASRPRPRASPSPSTKPSIPRHSAFI